MKYGLHIDAIKEEDFIFGDGKLNDQAVNPSADWAGWLPEPETQVNGTGFESYACVSFATTNVVETLERFEYGATQNFSDRFLATASGTAARKGNSLQEVSETLRKKGCVEEKDLPFDHTITTFEKFYAPIPQRLFPLAIGTFAEYAYGHSYVPSDYEALMEALKYSPLTFTVYAWAKNEDGIYYRPQGMTDNHCVMCYGYVRNNYWLVFDSYSNDGTVLKKIRWDSLPMQAKRHTLNRQVVSESLFSKFIKGLRSLLGI